MLDHEWVRIAGADCCAVRCDGFQQLTANTSTNSLSGVGLLGSRAWAVQVPPFHCSAMTCTPSPAVPTAMQEVVLVQETPVNALEV